MRYAAWRQTKASHRGRFSGGDLSLNSWGLELANPKTAIRYGAAHLKDLSVALDGKINKAAAAYNAGVGAVSVGEYPRSWVKEFRQHQPYVEYYLWESQALLVGW